MSLRTTRWGLISNRGHDCLTPHSDACSGKERSEDHRGKLAQPCRESVPRNLACRFMLDVVSNKCLWHYLCCFFLKKNLEVPQKGVFALLSNLPIRNSSWPPQQNYPNWFFWTFWSTNLMIFLYLSIHLFATFFLTLAWYFSLINPLIQNWKYGECRPVFGDVAQIKQDRDIWIY